MRTGDGSQPPDETFDAILVNAGVTHPLESWLDALKPGGRMILPLTATMPSMGTIGKGPLVLVTRREADFEAKLVTVVAIYSAEESADSLNDRLGKALMRGQYPNFSRLRRDPHGESGRVLAARPGASACRRNQRDDAGAAPLAACASSARAMLSRLNIA